MSLHSIIPHQLPLPLLLPSRVGGVVFQEALDCVVLHQLLYTMQLYCDGLQSPLHIIWDLDYGSVEGSAVPTCPYMAGSYWFLPWLWVFGSNLSNLLCWRLISFLVRSPLWQCWKLSCFGTEKGYNFASKWPTSPSGMTAQAYIQPYKIPLNSRGHQRQRSTSQICHT